MEPIKITLDVNVELSEKTKQFLSSLLNGQCACKQQQSVAPAPTPAPTPAKPTPAKPTQPAPAPAKPTQPAEPEPTSTSISIEDIRSLLQTKINDHREDIKAMLTSLGAKNVTTLDKANYDAFYEFLNNLE